MLHYVVLFRFLVHLFEGLEGKTALPVTAVNVEEQNEEGEEVTCHIRASKQPGQAPRPVFPSGNLKRTQSSH